MFLETVDDDDMWTHVILIMMTYLVVKHFVCDFPFHTQTPWMFLNKGKYGHPGGLAHAGIQALASAPLFFCAASRMGLVTPTVWQVQLACLLILLEFLVHYHMDWFKMWYNKRRNWTPQTPQFWTFLGVDQLVHYLTYVLMVGIWVAF